MPIMCKYSILAFFYRNKIMGLFHFSSFSQPIFCLRPYLNSDRKWIWQKYLRNFFNEKFRKQFHLFTCILPDYVGHESLKAFWKNSHFENMRADFLRQCQNWLRQTSPRMMHFQEWKKIIINWYYVIALDPIRI